MAEEPASPVFSPLVSALSSSASSPRSPTIAVSDKELGILDEHVPMVVVQQFIDANKEKGTPTNARVADLKKKRDAIKAERKKISMELRNEERKRSRLKSRAKKLTAEDLVQVIALRAQAASNKKRKAEVANAVAANAETPKNA